MKFTRVRLATLAVAVFTTAWTDDRVIVEDWRSYALGTRGIPGDWKGQTWGRPVYDLEIVSDNGQPVLHLRSKGETSTITRHLKSSVDLDRTPVLEWSWKVTMLPAGGNACQKSTDDEAAQVYGGWLRSPESVRSRIIGYVWDSTAPAGTVCKSQKIGTVTYIVLRSGADQLGKWVTERRNVVEDFLKIYGEPPETPTTISFSIDSDDTRSAAESLIGAAFFTRP
jgi:hypothetical protein